MLLPIRLPQSVEQNWSLVVESLLRLFHSDKRCGRVQGNEVPYRSDATENERSTATSVAARVCKCTNRAKLSK